MQHSALLDRLSYSCENAGNGMPMNLTGMFVLVAVVAFLIAMYLATKASGQGGDSARSHLADAVPKEVDSKLFHLQNFLSMQRLLLDGGEGEYALASDRERLLCLHFVMGSIDRLSRTFSDDVLGGRWQLATTGAEATVIFGVDRYAIAHKLALQYGRTGDQALDQAGARGWSAMETYLRFIVDKSTQEQFIRSGTELAAVVRQLEPA